MKPDQHLLTIAIPTWNRLKELKQCLDLVIPQVEVAAPEVEILISDNASDDGTEPYGLELQKRHSFLAYQRNQTNIGASLNFVEAIEKARGAYVWLFSDDDFMEGGAVAHVLQVIKTWQPAYIASEFTYCDEERKTAHNQPHKKFMIDKDAPHVNLDRAFLTRNHWLSFVSCNIYRRELCDCALYRAQFPTVPSWIQVYMTAHVLSQKPDGYVSSFKAVQARLTEERLIKSAFIFEMAEAFQYVFDQFGVDETVAAQVIQEIRATFLPFRSFLALRAAGASISSRLVPPYYKMGVLIPSKLILATWKAKRFVRGKGYTLPK